MVYYKYSTFQAVSKLVNAAQIRDDANLLLEIEHEILLLERFFITNLATTSTLVQGQALQVILKIFG